MVGSPVVQLVQNSRLYAAEVLLVGGLALASCGRAPETPPPPRATVVPLPPKPVAALARPPVGRAELLQAIDSARSAYAAGQTDVEDALAGRRFAIRQAFGCTGAMEGRDTGARAAAGVARWAWGRGRQTIEISLTPADWTAAPVIAHAGAAWEAVEGYWLTRPWLRTEKCPATAAGDLREEFGGGLTPPEPPQGTSPSMQVSGLAAVFGQESSRLERRDGKAFTLILRRDFLPPPANGYRLVIEGRFSAFPGGRAIHCNSPRNDVPPVCVAAAEVDRVAFEDSDGKLLKEWRIG